MKKNLWLTALVGVALTGCVSDEGSPVEKQAKEVTFAAPVMKTQSRANFMGEIDGITYPTSEDFRVYSWRYQDKFTGWETNNPTPYFGASGDIATHGYSTTDDAKYWTTQRVHYWPDDQYNLMFAAYSPADFTPKKKVTTGGETVFVDETDGVISVNPTITYDSLGLTIKDFRVQNVSDLQYDLMYSDRTLDRNETNNGDASVKLKFNHALASVVFSAQKATGVEYKITGIDVYGDFKMNGTFKQYIKEDKTGSVYSETSNPKWEDATIPVTFEDNYFTPHFEPFDVPLTNPAQFTKGNSALLMIPQIVPTEAYVILHYTITNNSDPVSYVSNPIKLSEFKYKDAKAGEGAGTEMPILEWEAGKRYIYRISFGVNTQIYFEPSVTDWVDHPTAIYTLQ